LLTAKYQAELIPNAVRDLRTKILHFVQDNLTGQILQLRSGQLGQAPVGRAAVGYLVTWHRSDGSAAIGRPVEQSRANRSG
jgi:hypothetical protein